MSGSRMPIAGVTCNSHAPLQVQDADDLPRMVGAFAHDHGRFNDRATTPLPLLPPPPPPPPPLCHPLATAVIGGPPRLGHICLIHPHHVRDQITEDGTRSTVKVVAVCPPCGSTGPLIQRIRCGRPFDLRVT